MHETCLGVQCPNFSDLCCRRTVQNDKEKELNTKPIAQGEVTRQDEIWDNVRRSAAGS